MSGLWILALPMFLMFSAQSVDVDETVSFVSADVGHAVTLHCELGVDFSSDLILWYKQKPGGIPQAIGMIGQFNNKDILSPFSKTDFQLDKTENLINLKILHVSKNDEAMYFCGSSGMNVIVFFSGIFLSVKDKSHLNISVFQSSVSDSVPAGASVTLQCSVLSESIAAELQVLWFRAAPPQSHPQIIYTHHNSHQCESSSSTHTCVYNFSKNILSVNDTGTYYCAVAVCGKIIFGNGTQVQIVERFVSPLLIILAVSLGVCGIMMTAQTMFIYKRIFYKYHSERLQGLVMEKTTDQGGDVELNYTALHFNKRKTKQRKSEQPQDIVYSEVRHLTVTG